MKPMTIQHTLLAAKEKLAVITTSPVLEAEILLAHALNKPRSYLHARSEQILADNILQHFLQMLQRRCNKEPIAYITQVREFWSMEFFVTTDTLIPRPETELLVASVLSIFAKDKEIKVADLGTGCGAIALALASECPLWQIYATDISHNAIQIARKNAHRFALKNISFLQGSWCTALPSVDFDVIISNPPYIAEMEWDSYSDELIFEPCQALLSGTDGLDAIRVISQSSKHHLKPGGYVLVEHGFLQGKAVREIFAAEKYREIHTVNDLSGQERVTLGRFFS